MPRTNRKQFKSQQCHEPAGHSSERQQCCELVVAMQKAVMLRVNKQRCKKLPCCEPTSSNPKAAALRSNKKAFIKATIQKQQKTKLRNWKPKLLYAKLFFTNKHKTRNQKMLCAGNGPPAWGIFCYRGILGKNTWQFDLAKMWNIHHIFLWIISMRSATISVKRADISDKYRKNKKGYESGKTDQGKSKQDFAMKAECAWLG